MFFCHQVALLKVFGGATFKQKCLIDQQATLFLGDINYSHDLSPLSTAEDYSK
jgi:hypothetical protein